MSFQRYQLSPSGSSRSGSTSSHDDVAMFNYDRLFEPEYPPNDISNWRSSVDSQKYEEQPQMSLSNSAVDGSELQFFGSNPSVHMPYPTFADSDGLYELPGNVRAAPAGDRLSTGKHPLASSHTYRSTDEAPPSKRSRKEPAHAARASGACTRCKRLKMKCSFQDEDAVCARCIVGGHECIVLGRKPRSPGMRELLRKQIREKDAKIDKLLARLNPTSSTFTPLSIVPSRIALTAQQRTTYRDVLAYYEKGQGSSKSAGETLRKFDLSTLEEEFEYDSGSDDSTDVADLQEHASALHINPLPAAEAPTGLVAKTALESRSRLGSPVSSREPESSDGDHEEMVAAQDTGIGNLAYFEPGPSANLDLRRLIIERQAAPDILLSGLVTNEDVGKLFDIYWRWVNPAVPVLDENIHTPSAVLGRCPFLFTVVCAISSRFYTEKPEIYAMAMHMAKASAANAFLDGWKTVEMCQAFLLMAAYMPPARRWDEDRTWFYSGIAFRLAVDLDLGRIPSTKPADERAERELLNRLRAYVMCYNMDRCYCINLGKSPMMPENDLIRSISHRFHGWKYGLPCDSYLVSMVELVRIMDRYPELTQPKTTATAEDVMDFGRRHKVFSEELDAWNTTLMDRCVDEHSPNAPEDDRLRMALVHSMYQYCRLVTYSTGLQRVVQAGKLKDDVTFLPGCLSAASAVINCVMDRILPTEFIRYSPEYFFALSAFGTAVLLKCLRPEFSCKIDTRQESRIIELVKRLLNTLDSAERGLDGQPTPRHCFAKFLQQVLMSRVGSQQKKRPSESALSSRQPETPPVQQAATHQVLQTQHPLPSPDIKVTNQFSLPPSDPAFLHAWNMMDNQQLPGSIESLLGFSDTQLATDFMHFDNPSWFPSFS